MDFSWKCLKPRGIAPPCLQGTRSSDVRRMVVGQNDGPVVPGLGTNTRNERRPDKMERLPFRDRDLRRNLSYGSVLADRRVDPSSASEDRPRLPNYMKATASSLQQKQRVEHTVTGGLNPLQLQRNLNARWMESLRRINADKTKNVAKKKRGAPATAKPATEAPVHATTVRTKPSKFTVETFNTREPSSEEVEEADFNSAPSELTSSPMGDFLSVRLEDANSVECQAVLAQLGDLDEDQWLKDLGIEHAEVWRWMDGTEGKALAAGRFGSVQPLILFAVLDQVTVPRSQEKGSETEGKKLAAVIREKKVNDTLTTIMNVCLMCASLLEHAIFSPAVRQQFIEENRHIIDEMIEKANAFKRKMENEAPGARPLEFLNDDMLETFAPLELSLAVAETQHQDVAQKKAGHQGKNRWAIGALFRAIVECRPNF